MLTPDDLLSLYVDAVRVGTRHLAQIYRVKYGLLAGGGEFNTGPFADETSLVINPRRSCSSGGTVAFLASINQARWIKKGDPTHMMADGIRRAEYRPAINSIFLLKRGWNYIGTEPVLGDYDCLDAPNPTEELQCEVNQGDHTSFVSEYHSSNGSVIVPREEPRFAHIADPRFDEKAVAFGNTWSFLRRLHLENKPYELREGDVLLTCKNALVYGLATYPGGLHLDELEMFRPLR